VLAGLFFVQGDIPAAAFAFGTGPEVSIFGHPMSSMSMTYIGAVKNIAFTPVAALFGVTIESVRYFTIALSAATMLATYIFARRLFRDAAAAVAVALLAFDPSFVFYSRVDFGPVVVMLLLKTLAAWQLLRWYETGRHSSLAIGAFLLGLGLYDKANFAWVIAAFVVAAAILGGRRLRARLTRRAVLVAAVAFLVGCLPLLIYNAGSGFGTLAGYDALSERAGSFPFQVAHRVAVLGDLLDGSAVSEVLELPFPHRFLVLPLIFGIAAGVIALPAVRRRLDARALRAGSFIVVSLAVTLLLAAATSVGFKGHHVLTTYPLPHLALALVIVQMARVVARHVRDGRRVAVFASTAGVLAVIPVALSALTRTGMLDALQESGGRAEWSDRIVLLDEYLTREHEGPAGHDDRLGHRQQSARSLGRADGAHGGLVRLRGGCNHGSTGLHVRS